MAFCRTQFLREELLAAVQEDNPRQYARYEDRLRGTAEALVGIDGTAAAPRSIRCKVA